MYILYHFIPLPYILIHTEKALISRRSGLYETRCFLILQPLPADASEGTVEPLAVAYP